MIRTRTHDAYNVQWSRSSVMGEYRGVTWRGDTDFYNFSVLRKSSMSMSLYPLRFLSSQSHPDFCTSSLRFTSHVASFAHVCLLFLTQFARNGDEPRACTHVRFSVASSTGIGQIKFQYNRRSLNFCFPSTAMRILTYEYQMPFFLRYTATPTSCRLHNATRHFLRGHFLTWLGG